MIRIQKTYQFTDGSSGGMNTNYPAYDQSVYDGYDTGFRRFNGFEWITIVVSVIALLSVFVWGLTTGNTKYRDDQRLAHSNQILSALDNYYKNSNTIPSNRSYPVSFCGGSANTTDFELTLRDHLTGKRIEKDSHVYIEPDNFPRDRWGQYSQTLGDRKVPLVCESNLQLPTKQANQTIYPDGREACNFLKTSRDSKQFQCYLYWSSVNGDKFIFAHYNEQSGQMVFYSKFREDTIQKISCVPSKC
jgi:hypothetical protein